MDTDRRRHRRLQLKLPITRLNGDQSGGFAGTFWTSDVSTGGMYFHVSSQQPPREGTQLDFEMMIPSGSGYSCGACRVCGSGMVVRTVPLGSAMSGVGMQFNQSLSVAF